MDIMTVPLRQYFKQKILCPFDEGVDVVKTSTLFFYLFLQIKFYYIQSNDNLCATNERFKTYRQLAHQTTLEVTFSAYLLKNISAVANILFKFLKTMKLLQFLFASLPKHRQRLPVIDDE